MKARHARCHYCPALATTRDHIVPRRLFRRTWPEATEMAVDNIVPACQPCNVNKGAARSICDCEDCLLAWATYGPTGWKSLFRVDPVNTTRQSRRQQLSYTIGSAVNWQFDTGR